MEIKIHTQDLNALITKLTTYLNEEQLEDYFDWLKERNKCLEIINTQLNK